MKVNEIFAIARSFLGERANAYANAAFVLPWMNLLLVEALPYENSLREARGKALLLTSPIFTSLDDSVDLYEELARAALPYGLAFFFYNEDGEKYQAQLMRNAYNIALQSAAHGNEHEIYDVYGGDDND